MIIKQIKALEILSSVGRPTVQATVILDNGVQGVASVPIGTSKGKYEAKELYDGEVCLVLGGFHLGGKSRGQLDNIIAELRRLGVEKVAPCHCTGEQAMSMLADEWGHHFIINGVGRVITAGR